MSIFDDPQVPIGFGMALAQNLRAFNAFAAMDDAARGAVLARSRNAASKEEMRSIVDSLTHGM